MRNALVFSVVAAALAAGCDSGRCCRTASDCDAHATCFEGACAAACRHPSQCWEGQTCTSGACVTPGRDATGCAYRLDRTPPGGGGPGPSDAGFDPSDAGASDGGLTCDDPTEPNDEIEAATFDVRAGEFLICAADQDWYGVDVPRDVTIRATVTFEHDDGDLDLELYNERVEIVAASQGVTDTEAVEHVTVEDGRHFARVFGFAGDTGPYSLEISLTVDGVCLDDDAEPDDEFDQARTVVAGEAVQGTSCPFDRDVVLVDLLELRNEVAIAPLAGAIENVVIQVRDTELNLLAQLDDGLFAETPVTFIEPLINVYVSIEANSTTSALYAFQVF